MKNNKQGFTLIELLVVIVILGVLASIATINIRINLVKSRDAVRKTDLNSITKALELYQNDYGLYPSSDGGNITDNLGTATVWGEPFIDSKGTIYMSKLPQDPISNLSSPGYCYSAGVLRRDYRLCARLENARDKHCITTECVSTISCNSLGYNYCTKSSNIETTEFTSPTEAPIPTTLPVIPTATPTSVPTAIPTITPTPTPSCYACGWWHCLCSDGSDAGSTCAIACPLVSRFCQPDCSNQWYPWTCCN